MAINKYKTWYHWWVRILGKQYNTGIRLSNENQVIKWLKPTLNSTDNRRRAINFAKRTKKSNISKFGNYHSQNNHCLTCKLNHKTHPLTLFEVMYTYRRTPRL